MATYNSNKYGSSIPVLTAQQHAAITRVCTVTIPAAAVALADGDLLNLCEIPANHRIVGLSLFSGDLDAHATPTITFDVGLLDAGDAALDTVFVSASTLGQAGGTLACPATATMFDTAAASANKVLAIEITAAAATKHAAARTVGAVVTYVPE